MFDDFGSNLLLVLRRKSNFMFVGALQRYIDQMANGGEESLGKTKAILEGMARNLGMVGEKMGFDDLVDVVKRGMNKEK